MKKNKPVLCVFCGSSFGINPAHREAARCFGAGLAASAFDLVFGGGDRGLMGEVARAARAAGAGVTGVIPGFLIESEPPMAGEDLVVTGDLQQRKARMIALADGFAVLPGGLGTLDEFFEAVTTAQLGVHAKPVVLVNIDGFFDALDQLLGELTREGFMGTEALGLYRMARTPEEALDYLREKLGRALKV